MTQHTIIPVADRPEMPEGYGVPESNDSLLEWSWAEEILRGAYQYWLATVRPDGRPHAVPIWGAYAGGAIYIEGGRTTRWARNLAARPDIAVHVERGKDIIVVEGIAEPARDVPGDIEEAVKAQYRAKYENYVVESVGWSDGSDGKDAGGFTRVRPVKAFGWGEFPSTCTRWRFGGGERR